MRDFIALMISITIVFAFLIYLVANLPNPYLYWGYNHSYIILNIKEKVILEKVLRVDLKLVKHLKIFGPRIEIIILTKKVLKLLRIVY